MKKGCVYATTTLLYGNDGLIKIGSTSKEKPIERLETLSKQHPQRFYPLMWIQLYNQKSAEVLLHRFFAKYKYNGDCGTEWFKRIPIKELLSGFTYIEDISGGLLVYPGFVKKNGKWVVEDITDSLLEL